MLKSVVGGCLDGLYIRGQDRGGAEGGYDHDLQQNREATMIRFGFEERIHIRYDLGKIFLGSLLPCEGRKPTLRVESWRITRPSWSRGARHGVWSRGNGGRRTVGRGAVEHTLRTEELGHDSWASCRRRWAKVGRGKRKMEGRDVGPA
jgi:hypothetical protein